MAPPNRPTRLLTTGLGIPYAIIEGYPKMDLVDLEAPKVVEKYLIKSPNALAFWLESFPPPQVIGTSGFITLPKRRTMPNAPWLVTKEISYEPHTGDLPWDPMANDPGAPSKTYDEHCLVTITYETLQQADTPVNPNKPETFLERSLSGGGEYMSIPSSGTQVSTAPVGTLPSVGDSEDNKDKDMPMFKIIPTIEWNLKWPYVINPWWTLIFNALGTVNADSMVALGSPTLETVLFMGVTGRQKFLWNGQTTGGQFTLTPWELNFKFKQRHFREGGVTLGWNHVWSKSKEIGGVKGAWVKPTRKGGSPLYELSNHSLLFTISP